MYTVKVEFTNSKPVKASSLQGIKEAISMAVTAARTHNKVYNKIDLKNSDYRKGITKIEIL